MANHNDFCVVCGVTSGGRKLLVHHIEPYRIAANNDASNLVTTCTRCHPKLERLSDRIAPLPSRLRRVAVALLGAMLEDRWHLHQGRRLSGEAA